MHHDALTAVHTFNGKPVVFLQSRPWALSCTVLRIRNVDSLMRAPDVQKMMFPIIVDCSNIHFLDAIYIVFNDPLMPHCAMSLHDNQIFFSRRIEIRIAPLDELLVAYFGRGLNAKISNINNKCVHGPDLEWVTEQTKMNLCTMCLESKHQNGVFGRVEFPFNHVISFLRLFPWNQNVGVTTLEISRCFEIAKTAYSCLIALVKKPRSNLKNLPNALFDAIMEVDAFNNEQKQEIIDIQ